MPTPVRNPTTPKNTSKARPLPVRATAAVAIPDTQARPKPSAVLLVGCGLSLVTLVTYLLTLSPTVNFVDSGELITVGVTAGVAHAPGYPLYTLMLIAAAALPLG